MTDNVNTGWKPGDPVGYVRRRIPEFQVPEYKGRRYEAQVPDTLDMQDMATMSVNALTECTYAAADYEMYDGVYFRTNPPYMQLSYSGHLLSKFMESLPLMRIISGSHQNAQVERRWMEVALHQIGPDGVAYTPVKGRPWAWIASAECVPEGSSTNVEQYPDTAYGGRLLSALILYYKRDKGPLWKETAERMVDGLTKLAVDKGRYAYFAPSPHFVVPGSRLDYGRYRPQVGVGGEYTILGASHIYRETGYQPTLSISDKLIHYILDELEYIDADGRFSPDQPQSPGMSHFHQHTYALIALLEYARQTGNSALLERVRLGYEYAKANSNVLLGYVPEWVDSPHSANSETCEVADMIALGLKLTEAGVGDFWDEVDRWVRNMFAEGQLTAQRAEMIDRYAAQLPPATLNHLYQHTDRVAARSIGSFTGTARANEWGKWLCHCCTGNGTRSVYYVWQSILTHKDGKLDVNLLLNRASAWADVNSHIPYTGQVDVKIKQPVDLSLRIPEWVSPRETRVQVNGADRNVDWAGRYAHVGQVKPGELATLTFPIAERTETIHVVGDTFTIVRKGNDVVKIDPPGTICPIFLREHYRQNTTRWRKVERFVSDEQIYW